MSFVLAGNISPFSSLNLCVLFAIFSWALWGIFDKKALNHNTPWEIVLLTSIWYVPLCLIGLLTVYLYFPTLFPALKSSVWGWTALVALTNWLAIIAYLKAMQKADASYVIGMTAGYPIIMQFIAQFALHEPFILLRGAGSFSIAAGIFSIGFSKKEQNNILKKSDWTEMAFFIILATLGWGLAGILDKFALANAEPVTAFCTTTVWNALFCLLAITISWLTRKQIILQRATFKAWLYPSLSAACLACANMAYLYALSMATASYVIVICGCYPLLTYLLALRFLGEKFDRLRLLGITFVVCGGILTQLTASL